MKDTGHVVCDSTKRGAFVCRHCGEEYLPRFPIPLSMFTAMCRAFVKAHRDCEPRAAESEEAR